MRTVCTNVDPTLISDQRNIRIKYLQNREKNLAKNSYILFSSISIMPCFIYTNLISNLLVPRLVDPGSTLVHVCANEPKS